ncbi:MAG: DUF4097 family beta strand repeat-containing protein [Chloroflexota bacterium]
MPERELVISHHVGENGRFRLAIASGTLHIRGVDGDVAEVRARYRAPSGVTLTDDPEADGVVQVTREPEGLTVQVKDPGGSGFLAGLTRRTGSYRPEVDFDIRVPRGVTFRLDDTSADGEIHGLRGEQEIRTISGDLELHGAGGRIKVTTVSGDVAIAGDVLWVTAATTSGDIAVDAELVQALAARAVSGDISVRAALGRDANHTFEAVSGDLQLVTPSGVTVEMSGLSGSTRTDRPARKETRDGRKVLVIGDGAVWLRARTVSGDVVISGPTGGPARNRTTTDALGFGAEMAAFGKDMAAMGASLARDITAATMAGSNAGWPAPPAPPAPPLAPVPPTQPVPPSWPATPGGWAGSEATTVTTPVAAVPPPSPTDADQLAILRQLQAGEIDVDEAARRLEAML